MLILCALVCGIILLPDTATAWGPISHLSHGSEVLKNLTILGVGLQRILRLYPNEYLYGCVGADITLGKKFTRAMQLHCHSWAVGWQVLAAAESDAERAFGYGYLTHLAADVYSHNHFVPTQLIVSFPARALRHIYWEARFDTMQCDEYHDLVGMIRQREFPECGALFQRVVGRTIFSFDTNKRIFDSVLAFQDWKNWHVIMRRLSAGSGYPLPDRIVDRYNTACHTAVADVLVNGKQASCQAADPTGLEALTLAQEVRQTLKALHRRRALPVSLRRQIAQLNQRADLTAELDFGSVLDTGGAPG